MSTKIYEAYEWTAAGGLPALLKRLHVMRKRVFSYYVSMALRRTNPDKFDYWAYADAVKKAIQTGTWEIIDDKAGVVDNPSSSAVIYFWNGRTFVQFFGLPRDMRINKVGLKDWHYQNQSDPWYEYSEYDKKGPDWRKAMAKEYRERKRMWDQILRVDGRPSHSGLTFPFVEVSDGIRLASEMFRRIHGHSTFPMENDPKFKACQICARRRAEIKKEKAEA